MIYKDIAKKQKPEKIATKRLTMKEICGADLMDMVDIFSREEVSATYMLPVFNCKEDKELLFHKFVAWSKDYKRFVYGVYLGCDLIGFVNDVEVVDDEIELGFVINPDFKGQGYATEVLVASIKALLDMGYKTVKTGAFVENKASIRVMEKAGMTKIDYEDQVSYNGKLHTCIYYHMRKN
jgi:RimJ/RimL family protein N-acetyltransferase